MSIVKQIVCQFSTAQLCVSHVSIHWSTVFPSLTLSQYDLLKGKKRSYPPLSYTSNSGYRHTVSGSYSAKCVLTNHGEIGNIFSLGFRGGWLFCYLSLESGTHA